MSLHKQNYYPQVLLEGCKCIVKGKTVEKYINEDFSDLDPDFNSDDESIMDFCAKAYVFEFLSYSFLFYSFSLIALPYNFVSYSLVFSLIDCSYNFLF